MLHFLILHKELLNNLSKPNNQLDAGIIDEPQPKKKVKTLKDIKKV